MQVVIKTIFSSVPNNRREGQVGLWSAIVRDDEDVELVLEDEGEDREDAFEVADDHEDRR